PTRLCRAIEYTNSSRIREAPKYFVSSLAAINTADATRNSGLCGSSPLIQRIAAHIQIASIIGSHITLQTETNKPGVKSVAKAASNGERVNFCAKRHVPSTSASVGNRKTRCKARSDHPTTLPASAMSYAAIRGYGVSSDRGA